MLIKLLGSQRIRLNFVLPFTSAAYFLTAVNIFPTHKQIQYFLRAGTVERNGCLTVVRQYHMTACAICLFLQTFPLLLPECGLLVLPSVGI